MSDGPVPFNTLVTDLKYNDRYLRSVVEQLNRWGLIKRLGARCRAQWGLPHHEITRIGPRSHPFKNRDKLPVPLPGRISAPFAATAISTRPTPPPRGSWWVQESDTAFTDMARQRQQEMGWLE